MLQNGFIVTMMSGEWAQSRTLPSSDMMRGSPGCLRFCLHGMALLNNLTWPPLAFVPKSTTCIPWDFITPQFLADCLACCSLLHEDSLLSPHLFWIKWRISTLFSQLLLGLDLIWSDCHLLSCWEYNSCPDDGCPEFPWKRLAGSIHTLSI